MSESRFTGNIAITGGGLAIADGLLTIVRSSIIGNSASGGGGIYVQASTTLRDSTVSGNSATGSGGGILAETSRSSS